MRRLISGFAAIVLCTALAFAAGAADRDKSEQFLRDGRRFFDRGQPQAAIIQFRNAVQADPGNAEAQFALGRALTLYGDPSVAEASLAAALRAGYDPVEVELMRGELMFRQERLGELVETLTPGKRPPVAEARINALRGYAFLGMRQLRLAERSFMSALAIGEEAAYARAGLAQVRVIQGKLGDAAELLSLAVAEDPTIVDAWTLLGNVRQWQGDSAAAKAAFEKALERNPRHEPARRGRAIASVNIAPEVTKRDIAVLLAETPNHTMALLLDGLLKTRAGNYAEAEMTLQQVGNPEAYPAALYLLGRAKLELGRLGQAEQFASRYLQIRPSDPAGSELLSLVFLATGNFGKAVSTLEAAHASNPDNLQLKALLADAYLKAGAKAQAAALLAQIPTTAAETPAARVDLAERRLRAGDPQAALADFELVRGSGPLPPKGSVLRVSAYLRAGDLDKAAEAAKDAEQELPNDPIGPVLQAMVAMRRETPAAAREHFQRALKVRPDSAPIEFNIAQTYRLERDYDKARAAFAAILAKRPGDVDSALTLADIELQQGRTKQGIELLEKASATSRAARFRLVRAYIATGDARRALNVAREMDASSQRDPDVLALLGEAQMANREFQTAIQTWQRVVNATNGTPLALVGLARAYDAAGSPNEAARALQQAIETNIADTELHRLYFEHVAKRKLLAQGIAFARDLEQKRPDRIEGLWLLAQLLEGFERPREAARVYGDLAAKTKRPEMMLRQAMAQLRDEDPVGAIATTEAWLAANPDDRVARRAKAQVLMAAGRMDEALASYEAIVADDPDAGALNNLAILYAKKGDARAIPTAERAYSLAANEAWVADTLGWLLWKGTDKKRGLELLEKAGAARNATPGMKYRMAVALNDAGRRAEARAALEAALAGGTQFADAQAAQALLDKLAN